jgi:hypothetical protein
VGAAHAASLPAEDIFLVPATMDRSSFSATLAAQETIMMIDIQIFGCRSFTGVSAITLKTWPIRRRV